MLKSIINHVESNSLILKDINTIIEEDADIVSKLEQIDANEQRILNGAIKLREEVERLSADILQCEEMRGIGDSEKPFICPAKQRLMSILTN